MQERTALSAAVVAPARNEGTASRGLLRRAFDHWKHAAHAIGVVQTRFLMLVIYLVAVVPTGVLMRLSRDPLHLRKPADTNWLPARQHERNVDAARRQF